MGSCAPAAWYRCCCSCRPGAGDRAAAGRRARGLSADDLPRHPGLTAAQAQALALAGLPAAAELGLGTLLAGAQLKLLAAMPGDLRDQAAVVGDRFHLDAPGWYHDGDNAPHLAAVAQAVWHRQRIEIRYSRWAAPTEVTRPIRMPPLPDLVRPGG
jgi:predicted DNA-binding transcriptional regulator YafY